MIKTATQRDFTPVAQSGYVPLIVAVNNGVPAKTIDDFIQLTKASPEKYTWATPGLGTISHLSEAMRNRALGLRMEIVAYKGAAPQLRNSHMPLLEWTTGRQCCHW